MTNLSPLPITSGQILAHAHAIAKVTGIDLLDAILLVEQLARDIAAEVAS